MDSYSLKLLDNMEAGFALYEIVTDESGKQDMVILFSNKFYANKAGLTPDTIVGQLFSKVVPNDVAWIPIFAEVAFGKRKAYSFESFSVAYNLHAHAQLFSPEYGKAALIVHDRSRFMCDEISKEREEQGTRLLIGTMPEGLCYGQAVFDETGIIDVKCIIVNEAFELLMGVRIGSLQGNYFYDLYPAILKEDLPYISQAMKTSETVTFTRNGFAGRILEICIYPQEIDQMVVIVRDVTERMKAERELQEAHRIIMSSIHYSSQIQQNILPPREVFEKTFSDYSIIWKPRDIVGGDIYWMRNFERGAVLCVCDCTGHGTSGALLTMLVSSSFDDCVNENNCFDTAGIMWNLDQKLISVFSRHQGSDSCLNKDGCDLAVLFISKDGGVTISSAHMQVYVCDGKEVTRLKGQHIFIGEGSIGSRDRIKTVHIPANPDNKFYIASDGLTDQPGGPNGCPYGYGGFKKIILENHAETQSVISGKVWDAFEAWRGEQMRVDDFELISFQL